MPDYGHLDSAPHQAPLAHEDRNEQSRLARQKQQQKDMNHRVLGFLLCILILIAIGMIL